jgi:hypothetical protein
VSLTARRILGFAPWLKDPLWRKAQAVPSLDLRFADSKSLVDSVSGQSLVTISRASSATYTDSTGGRQTATTNEPVFDHNPTTGESLGLRVEEQRTNLLLNSATLATQSVTVTAVAHTLSFYGTGTVTLSGTSTAGPAVGSGAFPARTTLTFTPTAGSLTLTVSGSVTSAQLEPGAFATSYTPTTTAAATRAADVASITGSNFSSWYNPTGGTVFDESIGVTPLMNRGVWTFTTNPVSDSNLIDRFNGGITPVLRVNLKGVNQVYLVGSTLSTSNSNKVASGFVFNNFGRSANGASVATSATGSLPTPTQLNIGSIFSYGVIPLSGTIKRLTYWPQRLSDSTLQRLTQ